MRKVLVFFTAIFIISCGKTDDPLDGECGGVLDYANAGIFLIELVDLTGTNLIQDGTFNPNQITTSIKGGDKRGVFDNFDASLSRDTIRIYTVGIDGSNRWFLHLSEVDTDTLDFTLSSKEERAFLDGILYCGSPQTLNSASYNGKPIEFNSNSDGLTIVNISVLK